MKKNVFLTAAWKNLLMMNYEVPQEILKPFLPKGVELDIFQGKCLVSLVGFMFENTKVKGIKLPGHVNFEEFNLRFYVFRREGNEMKRGVVFVKEIVPKPLIAFVARTIYREPYISMPMWHTLELEKENGIVAYCFGKDNDMRAELAGPAYSFEKGSIEDFITEHYWGYNKYSEEVTMEYEVEHPSWKIRPVKNSTIHLDVKTLYGESFVPYLTGTPHSAFMAEGSEILVRDGTKL
jgi:uncharacterized protein